MYDILIIGSGPAGGTAATELKKRGLEVVLFEKAEVGGVCLNEGCIPSKALLHCAKRYSYALHSASFGVIAEGVRFDLQAAMKRKKTIIDAIRKASEGGKKRAGIPLIREAATILPRGENGLFRVQAGETIYEGKKLLICSGSDAIRPPLSGADQPFVLTNRGILEIDFIPKTLTVIGGGVIGLEFATLFSELGTQVSVIELLPKIAGPLEAELTKILQRSLSRKGVSFHLECKVTAIGDKQVTFQNKAGESSTIDAEVVLLSVGRRANTAGLGLENISVATERGMIITDERCRTNVPGVWAAGDVNGKMMLAHTAYREVDVVIDDIMGRRSRVNYDSIPSVIYTHPEVATVGLTAEEAVKRGYEVVENTIQMTYNGRYLAETEDERGIVKVVVDKKYGTILGVHMIGGECSEMIHGACLMLENELRVQDVRDVTFPHPTVAELIKDCIVDIKL